MDVETEAQWGEETDLRVCWKTTTEVSLRLRPSGFKLSGHSQQADGLHTGLPEGELREGAYILVGTERESKLCAVV